MSTVHALPVSGGDGTEEPLPTVTVRPLRFQGRPPQDRPPQDQVDEEPAPLGATIAADLRAMVPEGSGWRWRLRAAAHVALLPKARAVVWFRLSQWLARRGLTALALAVDGRVIRTTGAELSPWARIGPGMHLMHSVGIVVGPEVRIGRRVQLYQGATLGDGGIPGQPRIGDDVTIGAGASVLGGVSVGDRAVIGAGAVVVRDVPPGMHAVGVPARVVGPVTGPWAR